MSAPRPIHTPEELRRRIAAVPSWYHVLELAPGILTPGTYDMRPHVGAFDLPSSLAGLHVLDVGASNGFFSFHFEALGAERVVAADLRSVTDHDVPRWYLERWREGKTPEEIARIDRDELDAGFELARSVYGARVERIRHTVYELGRAVPRAFDLTFCNNLLLHLRDPGGALESLRETLKPGGKLVLGSPCDLSIDASYGIFQGNPWPHVAWWVLSREALLRMCRLAGFTDVEWRGSFEFTPTDQPGRVGVVGVLHAVAPEEPPPWEEPG